MGHLPRLRPALNPSPRALTTEGVAGETLVIAHRGASGAAPENSLEAFELAIDAKADMIELDVRRTADYELIVFHDAEVSGERIGRLTRSEVAERTGRTPPLLDEVLELVQGRVKLDVELKEDGYIERALAQLNRYLGPEEMIVTSFLDDVLIRVKQVSRVKTGLVLGVEQPGIYMRTELRNLFPAARLRRCGADFVVPSVELLGAGVLGRMVLGTWPALVWTVNDSKSLIRYLADEQIAGIITDVPGRARSLRDGMLSAP